MEAVKEAAKKVKVPVKILSGHLIKVAGVEELTIEVSEGEYTLSEIISIILKRIPKLKPLFESKDPGKQPFVAVNGEVSYNRDRVFKLGKSSRITIFSVGAGG